MGKLGKLRKKRRLEREMVHTKENEEEEELIEEENGGKTFDAAFSSSDISSATRVITAMAENPDAFKGKEYKSLRAALHALRQSDGASMVLGFGKRDISLSQVVSDALRDERWSDALVGLQKMRAQKQIPKLGAVCRWVRECDAAGEGGNHEAMLVLDAVLRTADPPQVGAMQTAAAEASMRDEAGSLLEGEPRHGGHVLWYPPWDPFNRAPVPTEDAGATMRRSQAQPEPDKARWRSHFRRCLFEKAAARKPPNQYDLVIHTSRGTPIPLLPQPPDQSCRRREVPFVPGAFLLEHVLSPAECAAIIQAGEAVGFDPDEPAGGTSAAGKRSVLAHAFVWCTDVPFIQALWARIAPSPPFPPHQPSLAAGGCSMLFMPDGLGGGEAVGLNRRWRCYRYRPGAVYRPHIDGGWPGSGLKGEVEGGIGEMEAEEDGAEGGPGGGGDYVYDAFTDGRTSRLTFLIYLNDDFQGGPTTFFLPDADKVGVMRGRGVRPKEGCALVFPHGETEGALLHEGSGVEAGAKYVVRSDVLYRPRGPKPPRP